MDPDLFAAQTLIAASTSMQPTPDARAMGASQDPRKVAEEFEAFFISQVIETMSQGIESEEPFGGGAGESAWRSMLNEQYAQAVARAGGIGLADRLTAEIIALQAQETNNGAHGA